LLRETTELGARQHHPERPGDGAARTTENALKIPLLFGAHRVVGRGPLDAAGWEVADGAAQILERGRLLGLTARLRNGRAGRQTKEASGKDHET
jgi:hypothetical protein